MAKRGRTLTRYRRVLPGVRGREEEVGVYKDFDISNISNSHRPGKSFMLRYFDGIKDPETGEELDVDGDRACIRIIMDGAEVDYVFGVEFEGFVDLERLEHEQAALAGDLDACIATRPTGQYVVERWEIS